MSLHFAFHRHLSRNDLIDAYVWIDIKMSLVEVKTDVRKPLCYVDFIRLVCI